MSFATGLRTLLVVALLFAFLAAAPPTRADTIITVTTTADDLTVNGNCTLREAVIAANTDAAVDACPAGSGADTIILPAGAYTLQRSGRDEDAAQTGDLDILDNITITGAGPGLTVIDANALDRIFHVVNPASQVTIEQLTITNGDVGDPDEYWCGGAILNTGALAIHGVHATHSLAYSGGGLCSSTGASANIIGSEFHDNRAWMEGGGIYNAGILAVNNTVISGNEGHAYAGGLYNTYQGVASITRCRIEANWVFWEEGGGVINDGVMQIADSTLVRNDAAWFGGGIVNAGSLTLSGTLIAFNEGGEVGGGICNCGRYGSQGGGTIESTNCTFAGNRAEFGSAIANAGQALLTHNTVLGSLYHWGVIYNDPEYDPPGTTHLRTSIVTDCAGPVISEGYNLDTDSSCSLTAPGDLSNTDPMLGPLADNGGPTLTMALLPGSPAIDHIPAAECTVPTDQRGISRPQPHKGNCDIGAYELGPLAEIGWIIEGVKDLYRDGALDKAQYRTLYAQLKTAGAALLSGDNAAACANLQTFVDQVQTYVDEGRPTPEQAQPLLDGAQRVMAIVCP